MKTKKGIDVIAGVSEALKFRKENNTSDEEKVMQHILNFIKKSEYTKSKFDIIAGVSYALKILEREPKVKDKEVINRVLNDLPAIVEN